MPEGILLQHTRGEKKRWNKKEDVDFFMNKLWMHDFSTTVYSKTWIDAKNNFIVVVVFYVTVFLKEIWRNKLFKVIVCLVTDLFWLSCFLILGRQTSVSFIFIIFLWPMCTKPNTLCLFSSSQVCLVSIIKQKLQAENLLVASYKSWLKVWLRLVLPLLLMIHGKSFKMIYNILY